MSDSSRTAPARDRQVPLRDHGRAEALEVTSSLRAGVTTA
jgi:hypothetical protein